MIKIKFRGVAEASYVEWKDRIAVSNEGYKFRLSKPKRIMCRNFILDHGVTVTLQKLFLHATNFLCFNVILLGFGVLAAHNILAIGELLVRIQ